MATKIKFYDSIAVPMLAHGSEMKQAIIIKMKTKYRQ